MFAYYFVYFFYAINAFLDKKRSKVFVFFVIITLLIGLRYETGGDWGGYLTYLDTASDLGYFEILNITRKSFCTIS